MDDLRGLRLLPGGGRTTDAGRLVTWSGAKEPAGDPRESTKGATPF